MPTPRTAPSLPSPASSHYQISRILHELGFGLRDEFRGDFPAVIAFKLSAAGLDITAQNIAVIVRTMQSTWAKAFAPSPPGPFEPAPLPIPDEAHARGRAKELNRQLQRQIYRTIND